MSGLSSLRHMRSEVALGQENLRKVREKTVAVVGLGGIGSNAAALLAQIGVKKLVLIDFDNVQLIDLNRSGLFDARHLGKMKAEAAKERIEEINNKVQVVAKTDLLARENAGKLLQKTDIVLDGTDNFNARKAVNRFCLRNGIPWVYASALGMECMLSTILPGKTACFECFAKQGEEVDCATVGTVNTVCSFVASMQVQELINVACFKPAYAGKLFYADLKNGVVQEKNIGKRIDCIACAKK